MLLHFIKRLLPNCVFRCAVILLQVTFPHSCVFNVIVGAAEFSDNGLQYADEHSQPGSGCTRKRMFTGAFELTR